MRGAGYDQCDACGVISNRFPFPHAPGCKYGTGDKARDSQIYWATAINEPAASERGDAEVRSLISPKESAALVEELLDKPRDGAFDA